MNKKIICIGIVCLLIMISSFTSISAVKVEKENDIELLSTTEEKWVNIISPQNDFSLGAPITIRCEVSNNFDFDGISFKISWGNDHTGYDGFYAGQESIVGDVSENDESFITEVKWMRYIEPQEIRMVCRAYERIGDSNGARLVATSETVTGDIITPNEEQNPAKPTISGPISATWSRFKNIQGEYYTEKLTYTMSVDYSSERSKVQYFINWHPGVTTTMWMSADKEFSKTHQYKWDYNYCTTCVIKVTVTGDNGMESQPSDPVLLHITTPESISRPAVTGFIARLYDRFPLLQNLLKH